MTTHSQDAVWAAVDRLVDRAPTVADLVSHRLHLLAARRWRATGRPVPPELADLELEATFRVLAVPELLRRVRAAYDGPLIVMKGPELASRYPDRALRPLRDLDLLVVDSDGAQKALLAAGFFLVGDEELYRDIHHLQPVACNGLPLWVELHHAPKWPDSLRPPTVEALLAAAVPARVGTEGFLTLPPGHHALVAAAHSWAHEPLRRVGELLDIALLVAEDEDRAALRRLAREWGIERLWRATLAAVEAIFDDGRTPASLRLWAQNVRRARERTVLESHLSKWLSSWWALPPPRAARATGAALLADLRPESGEEWPAKLRRTQRALRDAFTRRSEHDRAVSEGRRNRDDR